MTKTAKKATPKKAATKKSAPKKAKKVPGDLFAGSARESRPRVKFSGGTMLFREHSPYRGQVVRTNPGSLLLRPVRVEMTADEAAAIMAGNAAAIRELRAGAGRARRDWDHLEAHDSRGAHLFDMVR